MQPTGSSCACSQSGRRPRQPTASERRLAWLQRSWRTSVATSEPSVLLAEAEKLRREVDALRNAQSTARQIEGLERSHAAIDDAVGDLKRYSEFLTAVREDKAIDVPARRLMPIIQAAQAVAGEADAEQLPEAARTLQQQLVSARDVLRDRAGEV